MGKKISIGIGLLLILAGLGLFLQPDVSSLLLWLHTRHTIQALDNSAGHAGASVEDAREPDASQSEPCAAPVQGSKEADPRYQQMLAYNQELYSSRQAAFTDERSYAELPESLAGLDELGYIEIPAMKVTLPLYCGATEQHMAQGAAVLAQTSMPIGGENTNCVIAGHRGYRGAPYFREIEKVQEGDLVYVTNLWETLCYRVREITIIAPNDNEAILIRDGEDLVTLLTCHPYRSGGKYRYLVICERCEGNSELESATQQSSQQKKKDRQGIIASDGAVFASSEPEIRQELMLRRIVSLLLCFLLIVLLFSLKRRLKSLKKRGV